MLGLELIEKVLPVLKNGEYLQDKASVDQIVEALLQVKHFYTLIRYESQKSYLVQFIEKMEVKTVKKGDVLYDKGKANEGLYIIIQGEFSLWEPKSQGEINNEINLIEKIAKLQGAANQGNQTEEGKKKEQQAIIHLNFIRKKEDDELLRNQRKNNYFLTENVCALKRMRYLQIGDSLNEECVVSGAKTQYTALAQKDSVLLGISAKEYLSIFDLEISKLNFISEVLAKNFANSKPDSITRLAYKFKEELFPYGSMVFHQEDPSNLFMIIKTGLVEISKIKYPEIPGINTEDKESKPERSERNIQKVNTDEQITKIKQEMTKNNDKEKNNKIENEIRNGSDPHLFLRKKATKVTPIQTEEDKAVKEYQKYYGDKTNNNNNNKEEQQIEEEEDEQQYIADIAKQRDERNLEKGLMSPKKSKKQTKKRIVQASVLQPMKFTHGGQLIRLGIIGPGEVLGLDDFIKHRQRTYSAKSIAADTLIYYITRSKIDDIINLNEDYNLKKAMKDQANKKTDWHNNQQLNIARINQGIDGFSGGGTMEDLSPNLYETKKQLQESGNLDFKKVVQKLFDDRRTQLVEKVIRKEINASPIKIKDFAVYTQRSFKENNQLEQAEGEGEDERKIKKQISDSDSASTPPAGDDGDQEDDNNFFIITDSPRKKFLENSSKDMLSLQHFENVSQADSQSLSPTSILKNKRRSIYQGSPSSRLGSLSPQKVQNTKTVAFLDFNENNNYEVKRETNEIVLNLFQQSSQQTKDVPQQNNKLRSQQSLWQFQEQYEQMEKENKQLTTDRRKPSLGGVMSSNSIQQLPEIEYKNRFSTIFDEQPASPEKSSKRFSHLGLIPAGNGSVSHSHLPVSSNPFKSLPLSPQLSASKAFSSQLKIMESIPQLVLNKPLDVVPAREVEDQPKPQLEKSCLNTSGSQSLVRNYPNEAAPLSLRQKILYKIQTNLRIASRYQKYNPESSQGFIEAKKFVRRLQQSRKGLAEPQPNPLQHSKEQHIIEVANFMSQIKQIQIDQKEDTVQRDQQHVELIIQNETAGNVTGNNKSSTVIQEAIKLQGIQNQPSINNNNTNPVNLQQKHHKTLSDSLIPKKTQNNPKMPNIPRCLDAFGSLFHVPYFESQQTARSPAMIRSLSPNLREFKETKSTNNKTIKPYSEHVSIKPNGQFFEAISNIRKRKKSSINKAQFQQPMTQPVEPSVINPSSLPANIQEVSSQNKDSIPINETQDDKNEKNEKQINLNDKSRNNSSQNLPFTLPSLVPSKTAAQLAKQSISPQISFSVKMSRKNIAHKFSGVFSSPQNTNHSAMLSPGHQIMLAKNDGSSSSRSNVLYSSNSQIPLTDRNNSSQKYTQETHQIIHFHSAQNSPSKSTKIGNFNHQQTKDRLGENAVFNPGKVLIAVSKLDTTEDIKLKIFQRQQRIFSKQSAQEIVPSIAQRANNQHNTKISDQATSPGLLPLQSPDNSHLSTYLMISETNNNNTATNNRNISSKILSAVLPSLESSRNSLKIINASKQIQRRNQMIAAGNIALLDDKI